MSKPSGMIGRRFGSLTVLADTGTRTGGRHVLWRCRCDCGGEARATTYQLTHGLIVSCGCVGRRHLREQRVRNGIEKPLIFNGKLNVNNTSGVKGVTWHKARGKWIARIKIDGVNHHLLTSDDKAECTKIRQAAEVALREQRFEEFLKGIKKEREDDQR